MARNLADPSFEPTDEDFRELMQRAMGSVRAEHDAAERALRERIRIERQRLRRERSARSRVGSIP